MPSLGDPAERAKKFKQSEYVKQKKENQMYLEAANLHC